MKKTNSQRLPVDIKLPERVLSGCGTMFVILPTLDDLENFWREHQGIFEFACEGKGYEKTDFLRGYEWIFGTSKSAVVRTVMRWDELNISCQFYDWAKHRPDEHAGWFLDRDLCRDRHIEKCLWSAEDEERYRADCTLRTPESYRGWWELKNPPDGRDPAEWINIGADVPEIIDPQMSVVEVEKLLLEQTFDSWQKSEEEIEFHDRESIEKSIAYWREEKAIGEFAGRQCHPARPDVQSEHRDSPLLR